ncbi:hypothetical protein E3O42_12790 [Cryobacterium adonitolivorans]|uniref:Transposase n=1 Tax=Cryobacterium adonitolivorans TaxID=1259189 RepID=A0A4R8W1L7_9MICO|nr:hypothetical protein [Cryobacterium adonitolivorans]TFB99772.1 hypothetical protein E3O42_12790 [Cryobacterium adonitolivorans]
MFSTREHPKREIGRLVGVSRGTAERALETDRLPKYQRPAVGSSFDAFAPQVRALSAVTPTMPASTLAERVGWPGAAWVFRDKVAGIRPEYLPPDPADRLVHEPGRQVQCDLWFPHEPLPLGNGQEGTPPVLVMTSTFSGFFQALMLPSRKTPDLLGGLWSLLQAASGAQAPRLGQRDRHRQGQAHRAHSRVGGRDCGAGEKIYGRGSVLWRGRLGSACLIVFGAKHGASMDQVELLSDSPPAFILPQAAPGHDLVLLGGILVGSAGVRVPTVDAIGRMPRYR